VAVASLSLPIVHRVIQAIALTLATTERTDSNTVSNFCPANPAAMTSLPHDGTHVIARMVVGNQHGDGGQHER
jgi:hypothetical protein